MARCTRHWIDEDTLVPEAAKMGDAIIRAGMIQLPTNPYMVILSSCFLIDVLGSYQSGHSQLQLAKKMDPSFLEKFAIFSREQARNRGGGVGRGREDGRSCVEASQRNSLAVTFSHQ